MGMQYTEREIEIMKNIKKAFDPNNILNPKTIVD
jgi:glycolate oxidase